MCCLKLFSQEFFQPTLIKRNGWHMSNILAYKITVGYKIKV